MDNRKQFLVYIIANACNQYYTGMTNNFSVRIIQHNRNKVKTTKNKGPWRLVIYELCSDKVTALEREKYWKSGAGRKRRNRILKNESVFPYKYINY